MERLESKTLPSKGLSDEELNDLLQYATTHTDVARMARELLELRQKVMNLETQVGFFDEARKCAVENGELRERLAAAEKVLEQVRQWSGFGNLGITEALDAYDNLKNKD